QMGRLAHGGVVHVEIAPDGAHDDLTGVAAHPDADRCAVLAANTFRVALHGVLHPEGGVTRPHGVILVREGRTEEGHDSVAHHLIHRALVAMDSLHHPRHHTGRQLHRPLRAAV